MWNIFNNNFQNYQQNQNANQNNNQIEQVKNILSKPIVINNITELQQYLPLISMAKNNYNPSLIQNEEKLSFQIRIFKTQKIDIFDFIIKNSNDFLIAEQKIENHLKNNLNDFDINFTLSK